MKHARLSEARREILESQRKHPLLRKMLGMTTHKLSQTASHLAARLIGSVRVNRVTPSVDSSGHRLEKTRRPGAEALIVLGNEFLSLSSSEVEMFRDVAEWIRWEQYCGRLLYPVQAGPRKVGRRSISMRVARGLSLTACLDLPELSTKAFAAAGHELRRVHALHCKHLGASWSHGDLHADNVLYDADTGDVTVIDFDARHRKRANSLFRHTDDLKTLLLGVISRPAELWTAPAKAFLMAYGARDVLIELREQLVIPQGWASILLQTRTDCLPRSVLEERFVLLSSLLQSLISSRQEEDVDAAVLEPYRRNAQ
jgi:hypothetical protein